MHYILVSFGSSGDILPFVFLGSLLKKQQHRVSFITSEYFKSVIEEQGIEHYSAGTADEYLTLTSHKNLFDTNKAFPYVIKNFVLKNMERAYYLIEKIGSNQSVIIAQSIAPGARIASVQFSIPLITLNLQPVAFWSYIQPPVFAGLNLEANPFPTLNKPFLKLIHKYVIDKQFADGINPFLKRIGLPEQKDFFSKWFYSPDAVIGMFPNWFAEPATDWPRNTYLSGFIYNDEQAELNEEVTQFLNAGTSPIVFTAGSAMQHAADFFRIAADSVENLGKRAIFISSFPEQFPKKKYDTILYYNAIPFGSLFTKVACVVHHGGIGTCIYAIKAGIPQIVVPFAHDQPDNAHRIEKLNLGLAIQPKQLTSKKLNENILKIENSTIRETCMQFSERINTDRDSGNLVKHIENVSNRFLK